MNTERLCHLNFCMQMKDAKQVCGICMHSRNLYGANKHAITSLMSQDVPSNPYDLQPHCWIQSGCDCCRD